MGCSQTTLIFPARILRGQNQPNLPFFCKTKSHQDTRCFHRNSQFYIFTLYFADGIRPSDRVAPLEVDQGGPFVGFVPARLNRLPLHWGGCKRIRYHLQSGYSRLDIGCKGFFPAWGKRDCGPKRTSYLDAGAIL